MLWNLVGYGAFVLIIVGVLWEKYRNILLTVGAATLALYAALFLENELFTVLQMMIVTSGLLQLLQCPRKTSAFVISIFAVVACVMLLVHGAIASAYDILGGLGLMGIAFGVAFLPARNAFVLMTGGGVLMVVYAFSASAWVFFFLNIFFAIANIKTLYSTKIHR